MDKARWRNSRRVSRTRRFRTRGYRRGQFEDGEGIAIGKSHLEVSAGGDRDVLLAIHLVGDGRGVHAGPEVIAPDALAGLRVEGIEPAVAFAHEHEVPARGQNPADQGLRGLVLPGDLARLDIEGDEGTVLN